jgi:hypothetical protein
MFGAFFKQINALHGKDNTMQLQAEYGTQFCRSSIKKKTSYLVLQGLPTTITLTLRDATALRAFPYKVRIKRIHKNQLNMGDCCFFFFS